MGNRHDRDGPLSERARLWQGFMMLVVFIALILMAIFSNK